MHTAWHWDFGDGNQGEGSVVEHEYSVGGVYEVILMVEDAWGLSQSSSQILQIISWTEIELSLEQLIFPSTYLSDSTILQLELRNLGPGTLDIQAVNLKLNNPAFILTNIDSLGILPPGATYPLEISFAPQVDGVVADSLIIVSDAQNIPRATVYLQGRGSYVPPAAPNNVEVYMEESDAVITWEPVNQTIYGSPIEPDYYLLFYNGSSEQEGDFYYHGLTPASSYTHYGVGRQAQYMFYRVIAYKYYGARSLDVNSIGLERGMREAEVLKLLQNLDR